MGIAHRSQLIAKKHAPAHQHGRQAKPAVERQPRRNAKPSPPRPQWIDRAVSQTNP